MESRATNLSGLSASRLTRSDEFLLAEYGRLKDEQLSRISARDRLIYVNLAVSGVVASTAFGGGPGVGRLAIAALPWTCLLFGWLYWVNDSKVAQIGDYVRDVLREQANGAVGNGGEAFAWESYQGGRRSPVISWVSKVVVAIVAFVGPGLLAAAAAPAMTNGHTAVVAASATAAALLVALFALLMGALRRPSKAAASAAVSDARLRVRGE